MTLREQGVPGEHEEAAGEEGERPAGGQQGADREHQEESCFSPNSLHQTISSFPQESCRYERCD